jgi:hypothetical protein
MSTAKDTKDTKDTKVMGNKVSVTLTKPHTHAGLKYDAGSQITIDEADANWLTDNGIAQVNNPAELTKK